jgi:hypothetical protein
MRRQIWTYGINASGSQECLTQASVDRIFEVAKYPLDGHAITSIIKSASRIARSEQKDIDLVDIETYIEAYNALKDYMYATQVHSSQDRERNTGWRAEERSFHNAVSEDSEHEESASDV